MTVMPVLAAALLVIAVVYSSVGHGGASGYLMVMGLAGLAPEVMKPTALVLNLVVATTALVRFARVGGFRWRTLWPFLITSVPCAFAGGAAQLDPTMYKRLVAVVLVFAAVRLAYKVPGPDNAEPARSVPVAAGLAWGVVIGLLSGLVGVGGGIFLSPVLLLAGWATARQTAGVSAAFILINSMSGLAGFTVAHNGLSIDAGATAVFAVSVLGGGLIGTWIGTRWFGHIALRRMLAVILIIAGLKMLFAGSHRVTPAAESARLDECQCTPVEDFATRWTAAPSSPPAPSTAWSPGQLRSPVSRRATSPAGPPPTWPGTRTSA